MTTSKVLNYFQVHAFAKSYLQYFGSFLVFNLKFVCCLIYDDFSFKMSFPEPMGSVSPKISTGEDFKHIKGKSNHSLSLLCPAQAYPTPYFR